MRYIFWQNMLAIHQSAFIRALADTEEVVLVAQEAIGDGRQGEGWTIPNFGKAQIIVGPSLAEIPSLVAKNQDAVHIFSGINSYKVVYTAFKASLKYRCKRIVLAEPYKWMGFKGFLRRLKYVLLFGRYGGKIDALLTTGESGEQTYRKAFFPKSKIFQWGYFTESISSTQNFGEPATHTHPKLLFVGRLDDNKNVRSLISLIEKQRLNFPFESLTICGGGKYAQPIREIAERDSRIIFKGVCPNVEIQQTMREHDILVLPSLYDGWGAVVNEALMNGMRCVASENCGSSVLLKESWRGAIFSFSGENSLEKVLDDQLALGVQSADDRRRVVEWCEKSISGKVAAEYFKTIQRSLYNDEIKQDCPWMMV